jgi:hypothetical protein
MGRILRFGASGLTNTTLGYAVILGLCASVSAT